MEKNEANIPSNNETTGLVADTAARDSDQTSSFRNIPRKSIASKIFRLISSVAVLFTGLMLLAQIVTFAILGGKLIQTVLRAYLILFCVIFILVELEFEWVVNNVTPLKSWLNRGFLYSFVGVVGMEESFAALAEQYPKVPGVKEQFASIFLKISSSGLFSVGILYVLMGVLCLKSLHDRLERRYHRQLERFLVEQVD